VTVSNAFSNDPRARKEAASLVGAGFRVVVCGLDRTLSFRKAEYEGRLAVERLQIGLSYGRVARAPLENDYRDRAESS